MPSADEPLESATESRSPETSRLSTTGIVLAGLLLSIRFGVPLVSPGFEGYRIAFLGSLLVVLVSLVWWLRQSWIPRLERWAMVLLLVAVLLATVWLNHPTMGWLWCLGYGLPLATVALLGTATVGRRLTPGVRRACALAGLVLVCAPWLLLRTDGMTGDHASQFAWRWTTTAEQRLIDGTDPDRPIDRGPAPIAATEASAPWPGFRGPSRDGVVTGLRIATNWSESPPQEVWRRPIGPGWSSCAVADGRLFTQEQRGEQELVAAYALATGEPLWRHADPVRFADPMAGAGPRATPTVHAGRVIAFGSTGLLNVLDAASGSLVWTRDSAADTGASVPMWGFSSSPLVLGGDSVLGDELVIVTVGGRLAAYELATGEPRWVGDDRGETYSSPHAMTFDGVEQIVILDGAGASGVSPADGGILWHAAWKGQPLVQPARVEGGVLVHAGEGHGVGRLAVSRDDGTWKASSLWTSDDLRPNFNDLVVLDGHAYGFDGGSLACLDLATGTRRWRGGKYGHGQLLLLADQQLLLVLSERGELALVDASPGGFTERSRQAAISGKTWNHPVVSGDLLVVRNGQEIAVFRLPAASR